MFLYKIVFVKLTVMLLEIWFIGRQGDINMQIQTHKEKSGTLWCTEQIVNDMKRNEMELLHGRSTVLQGLLGEGDLRCKGQGILMFMMRGAFSGNLLW